MKGAGDMKLSFIEYISDVLIRIEDVIVWQSFFILKKRSNSCILGKSFKTIMCMARQMLNDGSVHVTVFNSENNAVQTTFQPYAPDNISDCYEYQVVEANIIQLIKNYLNMSCST